MKYHNPENLEQATELLDSILDGSTEYAIIATDLNDNIILWNKGAELIYGYTSDEMVGKESLIDLHVKNSIDNDILFLVENTFRSSILDREMKAIRKDGSTVPVSITVTPRVNQLNEIIGFLIIVRDITKLKISDQFRDVLLEIAHMVNASPNISEMCSAVISTTSKFLDIPVIYMCIFDDTTNEFCINSHVGLCGGVNTHCCTYTDDEEAVLEGEKGCYFTYSQLTINSESLSEHAIFRYIDPEVLTEEDYSVIHIPLLTDIALIGILHIAVPPSRKAFLLTETQVLSLIANEISAGIRRKRLEQEIKQYADNLEKMVRQRTDQLREKDAQLVQSGKLATLGEMATGIAHEINQPLGGISLMTQGLLMAKDRGKLNDNLLGDKLNSIIEQIERINKIITHLRTFARQSAEIKQEVNVNQPLTDMFKLIGQQLSNRNIIIELALTDDLPTILADNNKLEQVFLNIISNARDALDTFETVVNGLKSIEEPPDWVTTWFKKITIKTFSIDDKVVIEISDNASGIPESIRNKIFEPFFTTKEVGKGTGLGLSITYGIVNEFGGSIDVESKEMMGSKFTIKFPVYRKK